MMLAEPLRLMVGQRIKISGKRGMSFLSAIWRVNDVAPRGFAIERESDGVVARLTPYGNRVIRFLPNGREITILRDATVKVL